MSGEYLIGNKSSRRSRYGQLRLRCRVAAIAVAACFSAGMAQANPTNPVVSNGAAQFTTVGNLLQIVNTPNAIINWGSFSIGANEITRFIQQSSSSAVLNRVGAGRDPSSILGALQSNGRVFLINPNGITFGAGSQINVAGLVASTLNLSDADFLAGRMRFTGGLGNSVVNNGTITTSSGGNVYLVGNAVTNNGIITSPKGEVILAAGNSVELVNPGTPDLRVEITAPDNQALNLGEIVANSGRVGIYAGLINHSGTINANSVNVDAAGNITLKATQNVDLASTSRTTASGPQGGNITVQSGDTTLAAGVIEAKGSTGQGGTVNVLGNLVGLTGNASIDASGEAGGGSVLIGGDYQGKNAAIQNAFRTYVGPDTAIKADAVTNGDGGKVIVWSDDATRAYGGISVRGGSQSGNGGFVETSGKRYLDVTRAPDISAPNGAGGTWLLDPDNITISTGATDTTGASPFSPISGPSTLNVGLLNGALDGGGTVIVDTTGGTTGAGDININAPIVKTTTGVSAILALNAHNDINVNSSITGSVMDISFFPAQAGGGGRTNVSADINIGGTINATAGSGQIFFSGTPTISASALIAGTLNNSGTTTFNAAVTANNLSNSGTILGSGNITANTSFSWTDGIIGGSGTLTTGGGVATLTGPTATKTLDRAWTINSGATVSGGAFNINAGSVSIGSGQTLTIQAPGQITITSPGGTVVSGLGTLSFVEGALTVTSTGAVTIAPAVFNTGQQTGPSSINIASGTLRIGATTGTDAGTAYSGAGGLEFFQGTRTLMTSGVFDAAISTTGGPVNFTGANVTFDANAFYTPTGTTTISAGSVTFNMPTLTLNSPTNLTGGALSVAGNIVNNNVLTVDSGFGNLSMGAGQIITNSGSGTLNINGGSHTFGNGSNLKVINSGVVNVNSGTLLLLAEDVDAAGAGGDTGTWNVGAGAVLNFNNAFRDFLPGSVITGAGTVRFESFSGGVNNLNGTYSVTGNTVIDGTTTVNVNSATTFNNLSLVRTVGGTNPVLGGTGNILVNGPFNWSLGTITGGGTLTTNGASTIANGAVLNGRSWINNGTATLGGAFTANTPITVSTGGVFDLNNGSLTTPNVNINGGLLKGKGTVTGNVSNSGTVAPGASPGIMNIVGNYTQSSSGVLQIELGGTVPGTGYDQLAVSGNATLNGTLAVSQFGSFFPTSADTFHVITTGGIVSGAFSNVVVPVVFTGLGASYQSQFVELGGATGYGISSSIAALDPSIVREDKNIFTQVNDDKDIFKKIADLQTCN